MKANRLLSTLAALTLATTCAVSEAQALEGAQAAGNPAQGTWVGEAENRATSNTDQLAHQATQVRLNIGKDGALDGYAPGSGCKLHGQVHPGSHASRLKLDLNVHDCNNAELNGQLKDGEIGLPTPKTAVIKINGRDESNGTKRYITFGAKLARLEAGDQTKAQPVPHLKAQPEARNAVAPITPPATQFMATPAAKPETHAKARVAAKPDVHGKTKTAAKPDAHGKAKTAAKPDVHAKAKTAAKPDVHAKAKTAAKPDVHTKAKTAAKPDVHAKAKTAAKPDAQAKAKTAAKPDTQAKAKTATKSGTQPKAHAKE